MKKQIFCNVEIGVNFITHIYTLANAGFNDEGYIKKYGNSISETDKIYLHKHADYMSFLRRDHGIFAGQFYFVPSFFNMSSKNDFSDYFADWSKAMDSKSFSPIEKYITDFYNYEELFALDDNEWSKVLDLNPVFQRIGNIYVNYIDKYLNDIWPEISPVLNDKAEEINKNIEDNLIGKWETATGYNFNKENYVFTLFYAGKNGPSYNNVSYDKNTAFYGNIDASDVDMLSHEFGIHLLMPQLREKITEYENNMPRIQESNLYGNVSYMGFESLAYFYNKKVMGRETSDIDVQNDYLVFEDIYSNLYKNVKTPLVMYINGIKKYLEYKGIE